MHEKYKILFLSIGLVVTANEVWAARSFSRKMQWVPKWSSVLAEFKNVQGLTDGFQEQLLTDKSKEEVKEILQRFTKNLDEGKRLEIYKKIFKFAVARGGLPLVQALVELGVPLDSTMLEKQKPRSKEIKNYLQANLDLLESVVGNAELCEKALEAGAYVNVRNFFNYQTPLHRAAYLEQAGIVDLLIKAQANLDAQDSFGRTPLHLARAHMSLCLSKSYEKELSLVQRLRNAGANEEVRDRQGHTPSACNCKNFDD